MKDFDAVIFDMDGVIFDSERAVMDCWIELSEKYNLKDIEKNYLACIGTTVIKTREIMMDAYGESFRYDDYAKEASVMFHERYDDGRLPMKEGVREILDFLRQNGKKIGLASSTRKQSVVSELKAAGIYDCFDEIITGDMVSKSKPEPDIFLLACERIGVAPERAYAIEDSFNGIRSAHRAGMKPIMVPDLLPANDEMQELAEKVVDNLSEVINYLS